MQSSSQIIITNKPIPSSLQAGCPSCCPTNSVKALKGKITFHGLAHPKLTWGLPTLSLTTNSSWLPWGRVAMPLIYTILSILYYYTTQTSIAPSRHANQKRFDALPVLQPPTWLLKNIAVPCTFPGTWSITSKKENKRLAIFTGK